jgi:hypothetical protein
MQQTIRPSGRVFSVRVPAVVAEELEAWARSVDYVNEQGTVIWAEALRHLLSVALDTVKGTGMQEQLRMAYYNGFSQGWGRTKTAVIAALNTGDGEDNG